MHIRCVLAAFWVVVFLSAFAQAEEHSLLRDRPSHSEVKPSLPEASNACRSEQSDVEQRVAGQEIPAQFESVQLETSDITLFERFFETVLQADRVETIDHPQKDSIRGYCYRHMRIVIRQDFQHPRPTGWVQLNFEVPDAQAVHETLRRVSEEALPMTMMEADRHKVVRLKLKLDVMRGQRKAVRLEVYGPEGFLIGFDQYVKAQ